MKYQVNELEKMIIGLQMKDPKAFNVPVLTMTRTDDMDTTIYKFTKIMPYMFLGRIPVEDAVNKQPEYPVISVDTMNSFGGESESPTTTGNCHACGFDEKMVMHLFTRTCKQIQR